jgi:hypothetical protein
MLLNALAKHYKIYYVSISIKKIGMNEEYSISWHALSDIFVFLKSEGEEEERGQKFESFCNTSRDFILKMFIGYYTHDFPSL